jgi:hypothetical protein
VIISLTFSFYFVSCYFCALQDAREIIPQPGEKFNFGGQKSGKAVLMVEKGLSPPTA